MPEGVQSVVLMRGKRHNTLNFDGMAAFQTDGCSSYFGPYDSHNNTGVMPARQQFIFFVSETGNCAISTKIHFAQKANAKALILMHSDDNLAEINALEEFPGVSFLLAYKLGSHTSINGYKIRRT